VVALPEKPSGWTYVLDQRRVTTTTTAIQVAAEQLSQIARLLPKETIALLDRGYDSAWLWCRALPIAHPGQFDPFEKQPLLLPTSTGPHRQTRCSPQTGRQTATQ
jgi:hypothetical protein